MTVIRIALLTVIAVVLGETSVDPDLWGHVRFGHDIVVAGSIPSVDPYSFTSDVPWVNHEWLAEVVMYISYALAGSAGLVALKLVIVFSTIALVFWVLERSSYSVAGRDVVLAITVVGISFGARTVRPQLFSVLLFAALLVMLTAADRGRRRALWFVPPLFALWPNLHGGWLVGLGVLGVWLSWSLFSAGEPWIRRRTLLLVGALALVASLANPYGSDMWLFLSQTVRLGRADISEWQPVYRLSYAIMPWGGLVAFALVLVLKNGRSNRWRYIAVVALLAFCSFRVTRLLLFLALSVPLLLVPSASSDSVAGGWASGNTRTRRAATLLMASSWSIVLAGALFLARSAQCIVMPTSVPWLPDADAPRFVLANRLSGRMLTWFDWGEYAIWHFSPAIKVSMDGRRETVYSEDRLSAHLDFYNGKSGALDFARVLAPDFIWLPARLPVVPLLKSDGWVTIFDGGVSVILAKSSTGSIPPPVARAGPRCFPGP